MLLAVANRNAALCRPVFCLATVCAVVSLLCATMLAQAQSADLVRSSVDPGSRVSLKGHHPLWADSKNDAGAVPADLPIEHITIILNRVPRRQQAFEQF